MPHASAKKLRLYQNKVVAFLEHPGIHAGRKNIKSNEMRAHPAGRKFRDAVNSYVMWVNYRLNRNARAWSGGEVSGLVVEGTAALGDEPPHLCHVVRRQPRLPQAHAVRDYPWG